MSKTRKECGEARAAALTPEKRKEIATQAAKTRWEPKLPKATHQGILRIMGKELPCVVLDDGRRIITQKSVFEAFDRPRRGKKNKDSSSVNVPSVIEANNLREFISDEILERIQPIEYLVKNNALGLGYSAEIIPTVCKIYMSGRKKGVLTPGQERIADLSEILIEALSSIGIIGLIDEATGYQAIRPRDALEAYLNKILDKELSPWVKRFPDSYFANIYKIRGWPEYSTSKNKFSCVGTYTNDLIYSRIGEDVLAELKQRTPDTSKTKMHQWLTVDTGHPLLSKHMNEIIMLQKLAIAQGYGWKRFVDMVDLVLPKKINALELEPT